MSEQQREDILSKRKGGKVQLMSHKGKALGPVTTAGKAKAQETAINISKARAAGHEVPKPEDDDGLEPGAVEETDAQDDCRTDSFVLTGKGIFRRDSGPLSGLEKPRVNPGGFLEVDAYLSRTGVYDYRQPDGSIRHELRLEEDVFDPDVLVGFRGAPVTQEHPPSLVSPQTARQYSRGAVAGPAWRDGDKVAATLVIHDAELADDILSGMRAEVSPGYNCDVDPAPPGLVVDGKRIDGIQRRIQINHVAIVKDARGGDEIRVRLDGSANVGEDVSALPTAEETQPMADPIKTKTITIHGISGDVPLHVAEAYESEQRMRTDSASTSQAKMDATNKELAELRAKTDSLAAAVKEKDAQIVKMDGELKAARAPETISQAVKTRVQLVSRASMILGKKAASALKFDSMTDAAIRAHVLESRGIKLDALPAEQRDFYAVARFDEEASRVSAEIKKRLDAKKAADDDDDDDDDDDERRDEPGESGPGLSGKITSEGEGSRAEFDDDDDDDEEDPNGFAGPSMKRRKDSNAREPRRVRFLEPADVNGERTRTDSRRDRMDAKEKYDSKLIDLGRLPIAEARKLMGGR